MNLEKLARKIAARSPHPLHRHATIVIRGGAVISTGYNHDGIHAEIVALNKLWPSKRRGVTIVNIRITRAGSIGNSAPCEACAERIKRDGVRKVVVL